jgi:hypothetical protein
MHAKKNKINGIRHMQTLIKTKKSINIYKSQTKHQIKFRSHHWVSDNKNFETRSHLTRVNYTVNWPVSGKKKPVWWNRPVH